MVRDTAVVPKGLLVVLVAVLAVAMLPSSVLAKPDDALATRAYLGARYRFERAAKSELPAERAAAAVLVRKLRGECPDVAAGSPHNEAATVLRTEALVVVSDTLLVKDRSAIKHFLGVAGRLRWSDPRLRRAVGRYVAELRAELALKAPDLCEDLRAWAASGFQTAPADAVRADREADAASSDPEGVPQRLFAPYTRPDERAMLRRTKRLEGELEGEVLKIGIHAWSEILLAAGFSK